MMNEISPSITMWRKLIRVMWVVFLILYLLLLLFLTLISGHYGRGSFDRSMNLVPLRTILQYMNANINRSIIVTNLLGNVVAFMPMGFLLPLVSKKFSKFFKTVLLSAGLSLTIEVLQYVLAVGAADIDDLILNTLGGLLGYLIFLACRMVYKLATQRKQTSFS